MVLSSFLASSYDGARRCCRRNPRLRALVSISALALFCSAKAGAMDPAAPAPLDGGFWSGMALGLVLAMLFAAFSRARIKTAERESARFQELANHREYERNVTQQELVRRLEEERELVKEKMQFESQLSEYEKYASLAQLALGAAHEINNPLLGILSHLELEWRDATEERREEIEQCIEGAKRISTAVRGLLDYARPGPLMLTRVNLQRLTSETVKFLEHQPMFRQIELQNSIPADLPCMSADGNQLSQILMNLILNAAQATPPGGKITILADKVRFAEMIELRVCDTGCGIPADILPHVFEPFFTTKRGKGTGLGLSITQSYVRSHGGEIQVESIPGSGTTVRVTLPDPSGRPSGTAKRGGHRLVMAHSILIVDDEALTLRTIGRALETEGYEVLLATSGEEALKIIAEDKPDMALVDVVLPGINGIEVLRQAKKISPATIVVMMSAYHLVDRAVEAMKLGAYDYMIKPFHIADMVNTIQRATEMLALRVRVHDTVETAKGRYDFGRLVTQSPAMREVLEMARRAAESDHTTILIQGESGTGKEVLAKAIHYNSSRAQAPLIALNCAALPDTLLESELFGYEPGAFTDARRRKEGLIEKASSGTLFLDEIGNTSFSLQAKLLRVLEEGIFLRLGGTKPIQVDVRIVTATNKVLKEAVAKGEFREDLYYRLNVLPLFIPPLRERREDILPLALDIMEFFNKELKKNFVGFTPAAAELLQKYPWPGNIRELRNVIERAMILSKEVEIEEEGLPEEVRDYHEEPAAEEMSSSFDLSPTGDQFVSLRELEDRYIHEVLNATGQNKTHAARILGIHPTSLLRRLKKTPELA